MPNELGAVVRELSLERVDGDDVHAGTVGGVEVVASGTGIGTERATQAATRMLDATTATDHVMVVGIAGGVGDTQVGDVVLPAVVVDGVDSREFRPSRLSGQPLKGKLSTSDEFHRTPEQLAQMVGDGVVAVDMETAAIARVCEERGRPWSAVRAISDPVGAYSDDTVLKLAHPDGSPNVPAALRYMLFHPWRIPALVRLGRDASRACRLAAATAADQIRIAANGQRSRS